MVESQQGSSERASA